MLIILLSGCAASPVETPDPLEVWLAGAKLDVEETAEELYAAALGEGALVIYSISSRAFDVAKSFEAEYPGLRVIVHDIRGADAINQLNENYDAGDFLCDVFICTDSNGVISQDLIPRGVLYSYVPFDIRGKLRPGNDGDTLGFVGEAEIVYYNPSVFNEPPVDNWWALTEAEWYGRVYMPSPFRSLSNTALMSMMIRNSQQMEQAYIGRYGSPPDLSRDENAGKLFIRLLYENGVVLTNTADECVEFVSLSTSENPALAIMISSKLRMRDVGYEIMANPDMLPFSGLYAPNSVMIAGGAPNINAAKLFVRWILGEADGQGEGSKPYLLNGTWPVRSDAASDTQIKYEDMNFWYVDTAYVFENDGNVLEYLAGLIERN